MRLNVFRHRTQPDFAPVPAWFDEPGGTIGSDGANTLALPGDPDRPLCRIQAALRVESGRCVLTSLSGMASVSLNGRPLAPWEPAELRDGDEIEIGPYLIAAGDRVPEPAAVLAAGAAAADDPLLAGVDWEGEEFPSAQEASAPAQDGFAAREGGEDSSAQAPQSARAAAPEDLDLGLDLPGAREPVADDRDIFADLIGPGTLPVGSIPDMDAHPFDMDSAMGRNPEDPLSQLPPADPARPGARDPLDALSTPGEDGRLGHVLTDTTPSTLETGARRDPIAGTLREGREADRAVQPQRQHAREYSGGHVRPPTPRRED